MAAQNARLSPSPERDRHLRALREGAPAVITGQQVGLFGGPLYTLYKAATAIRRARQVNAVPVFWLQTEDHDLPEIARIRTLLEDGSARPLEVTDGGGHNRIPVAHCALPEDVSQAMALLKTCVGRLPHAQDHLALLARHYRPGEGWARAFAGVLSDLFAEEGLVFVDPRDPALAQATTFVHRRALEEAAPISAALVARARSLLDQGHKVPVHVRENSPLSFFHPEGAEGPRYRLEAVEDGYVLVGAGGDTGRYTTATLLDLLEREPLRFSTSALLRPILQDSLFRTEAYVGGPAEVAYYAQLPPLYERFGMPPPKVVQRAKFRLVDGAAKTLAERLGVEVEDASLEEEALLEKVAPREQPTALPPEGLEHALVDAFERALQAHEETLAAAGAVLNTPLRKTRSTVRRAAGRLARHYARAVERGDGAALEEVRRLRRMLQPDGVPQERVYGLSYFASQVGDRALVERILAAVDPSDERPPQRDILL